MQSSIDHRLALLEYLQLRQLADETRAILAEVILRERPPRGVGHEVLEAALDYLAELREGLALSIRAPEVPDLTEQQWLLQQVGMDWSFLFELGWGEANEVETVGRQVLAYATALVALLLLPKLPEEKITFPAGRHSYADISVPSGPGEVMLRFQEMEQVVWHANLRPVNELASPSLRRTYGFFEAYTVLADQHLDRFFG